MARPAVAKFVLEASLRREFGVTEDEFARMPRRKVRAFAAFLDGVADAEREMSRGAKG